jgi:hypothetical protein
MNTHISRSSLTDDTVVVAALEDQTRTNRDFVGMLILLVIVIVVLLLAGGSVGG